MVVGSAGKKGTGGSKVKEKACTRGKKKGMSNPGEKRKQTTIDLDKTRRSQALKEKGKQREK